MSFRKRHVKNKISRIKPRKSIFLRLWFWIIILILLIICSFAYFFLFYPGIQVKNIIISGNEKVKAQDLQKLVLNNADTGLVDFGWLRITSRSIFLINSESLDKEILEKFPIIEKVSINKNLPETLILGITERKPIGVYCSNECFLIDQNGIAFEGLVILPEYLAIVRQTGENGNVFTGENVIQRNIMEAIYKIEKDLKDNFQIDVKEALITSPIRLNIETSENWQIYFDISPDFDINLQLTKLNLLLTGEISPENRKNLRYINLIPKDKAIVCDNKICGD